MQTLSLPLPLARLLLARLVSAEGSPVLVQVGHRRDADAMEWLALHILDADRVRQSHARCIAIGSDAGEDSWTALLNRWPAVVGYMILPDEPKGEIHGNIRHPGGTLPLDELSIIGPGMHRFLLTDTALATRSVPELGFRTPAEEHWSRTIGAVGGVASWRRLVALRFAIVGCGRMGSVAASMLKRVGVQDICLVDPDRIEFHNCGEMDLIDQSDVGDFKVEALRRRMEGIRTPSPCQVAAISESMHAPGAVQALKRADVLISASDSDAARLGAALLSTLYHKVLLDVGTGVLEGAERSSISAEADSVAREGGPAPTLMMGADVRLVLPGDGCLLCRGGLTNHAQAVLDLASHRPARSTTRLDAARRIGSLRSLNQLAVATGFRMLEDLVAMRLIASTWVRLEYDERGRIGVRYPEPRVNGACSLCQNAGLGDEGL